MKLFILLSVLVCAVACKPPKFDQQIYCVPANFSASGVAVYLDVDRYVVVYPDGHLFRVGKESCVVEKVNP